MIFKSLGVTQSAIAERLGASQSQVSRILSGQKVSLSKLAEDVCSYAESLEEGVSLESVRQNTELLEAVRHAWDGTASHARALATVIRALAMLTRPSIHGEGK